MLLNSERLSRAIALSECGESISLARASDHPRHQALPNRIRTVRVLRQFFESVIVHAQAKLSATSGQTPVGSGRRTVKAAW